MYVFQCQDCLSFHLGVDVSLVPKGLVEHQIATKLTQHVQQARGYAFSVGGYHTSGSGFWLSAAYWPQAQIFVLRSRGPQTALHALQEAFQYGIMVPPDPGMLNTAAFLTHDTFLRSSPALHPSSLSNLLASSSVSRTPKPGFRPVTIAAYQATVQTSPQRPVVPKKAPSALPNIPKLGKTCSVCKQAFRKKDLLTSTYIGCGCD